MNRAVKDAGTGPGRWILLGVTLFAIWAAGFRSAAAAQVLVLLSDDLPPYREALEGFQKASQIPFKVFNIQGDPSQARPLAASVGRERHPLLVTLGTPALEAAIKYFPDVPTLFAMTHSPPTEISTHGGLTGVFLDIPLEKYLVLIQKTLPRARRVGILMSPLHFRENVEDMRLAATLLNIHIQIKKAATLPQALHAVRALSEANDVVILQPDPLFASEVFFEYALLECLLHGVPLTGISEAQVEHGAILGLAVDYEYHGRQAARLCNQVARGVRPTSLPVMGPSRFRPLFNLNTANALGIHIPADILRGREKVF